MTLRNRVQEMERRAGVSNKDPAEMTLAELCGEIVSALQGDRDSLSALLRHLPDDALQRQLEGLRRAAESARLASLHGPDLAALLLACADGVEA